MGDYAFGNVAKTRSNAPLSDSALEGVTGGMGLRGWSSTTHADGSISFYYYGSYSYTSYP